MYFQPESENYNDEAINSALQRLSIRQQQRQYSAHKGAGILHKESQRRPVTAGITHRIIFIRTISHTFRQTLMLYPNKGIFTSAIY